MIASSLVSYIVKCRWLPYTFPAEELLHLYHILLHAEIDFPCWRASSLVSDIVPCRWLPYTFPAEDLLHVYHILLHADDCLLLSLLKSYFTCIIYCYMQMIALYFPCWRAYSLVSNIVACRWLPYTFPAEELLHLYHILLHADDCLKLSLLKSLFTCIIYCYMQMIALYFPCWRASSLVSYIVTCRWLPYTFPAEELLHLYHILLHADDCLILSLLKIFFTCIIYCYMQMIALYFPCWRASSLVSYIVTCSWLPYTFPAEELLHLYLYCYMQMIALYFPCWRSSSRVSYIVTCRWLPSTFPAEELLHLYHILLHADDCLKLFLLKSLFTCIIYCYMQMIALYFSCWRSYSLVSYIVTCRWLPYTFPAEDLIHWYHILLHADDCLKLSLLRLLHLYHILLNADDCLIHSSTCFIYCCCLIRSSSLVSYIVTCRWLPYTFPAEELLHLYHILLHADDCLILSLLKSFFTCIIYCSCRWLPYIVLYPCCLHFALVSYIVTCRWLPYTFPAEELLHLYHILLHADDCLILSLLKIFFTCIIYCYMQMIAFYFPCWRAYFTCIIYCYMQMIALYFPCWRASSLVSYIVTCRWLPYTFPAEELLHLYHILLHADDCLKLSLLKSFFTCIIYCYMQMIALYFPCWRASSLVSYIVTCRWLPSTFPAEELLHLYHILLHADDCLILSLLKIFFTCIIYCYMQMIALYFPCWRASSLVSYIVTCSWLPYTFPAEELLHLYLYCSMQMIALYFPCWRASSRVSYIVTCRWLPSTFPAEELLHLYHILLHADDCLKLSLLKSLFTCIIYCYMQMIALYFPCWRSYSLVSYIVTCRWLPYTFPAEDLIHWYHILLHADDCLKLSLLRASSLVSYIVTCRWLPSLLKTFPAVTCRWLLYIFPAEELIHLYHILLHADDCLLLSLLKSLLHLYHILLHADDCLKLSLLKSLLHLYLHCVSYIVADLLHLIALNFPSEDFFTCIIYCSMQMIALYFPCWRSSSRVSYIVTCRWLPYTFPAEELHLFTCITFPVEILLHADDCLILSLLKSFFTCIWYCFMQMIALYFPCWRSSSRVSYIVTCRWLP